MSTTLAAPPQTPPPKAAPVPGPPPTPAYPAPLFLASGPQLHRLTVKQYEQMSAVGIFANGERVELLNGVLVSKMSINPPHATALGLLRHILPPLLPADWWWRVQEPIGLDISMPEPDMALVRGGPRTFTTRHPHPAEIGLLIEVSHSSLALDRGEKLQAYAANGIVEYWIVNLVDNRIEVYTQPSGPTAAPSYGSLTTYAPGQAVPLALDGAAVASVPVADVLP
jgi:Uma2 family endonuclease